MPENRCSVCRLNEAECVCAELPRAPSGVEICLLQHATERDSESNTGALAAHVISNTRFIRYGSPDSTFDLTTLWEPEADDYVFFPREGAPVIGSESMPKVDGRLRRLIVLDATWRKGTRMLRRVIRSHPEGRPCSVVQLPRESKPRYSLRRPVRPGQMGTAEAVAIALERLGETEAASALNAALEITLPRILARRGRAGQETWARDPLLPAGRFLPGNRKPGG
ncbi:MAG: tRNA-uridine aminocarboxypropyltransferase [Planctomycetota bacterium]